MYDCISGPMTFTMVLNNKKIKVPAQVLITFPEKHTFEVRVHVYSGRALTSPDVSGYCSESTSLLSILQYSSVSMFRFPSYLQTGKLNVNGCSIDI